MVKVSVGQEKWENIQDVLPVSTKLLKQIILFNFKHSTVRCPSQIPPVSFSWLWRIFGATQGSVGL